MQRASSSAGHVTVLWLAVLLPALAQAAPQQRPRSSAEIAASRENARPTTTPATPAQTTTTTTTGATATEGQGSGKEQAKDQQSEDKAGQVDAKQREHQQVDDQFQRMDRNGDGAVSQDEYSGWSRERFDAMDRDRNYYLSESERKAGGSVPGQLAGGSQSGTAEQSISDNAREAEAAFRAADSNGDGRLDKTELQKGSARGD